MPQLLTNIKAQQQIDGYGSFNAITNTTISRQSKMMIYELRVQIPLGFVVGGVVGGGHEWAVYRYEYK